MDKNDLGADQFGICLHTEITQSCKKPASNQCGVGLSLPGISVHVLFFESPIFFEVIEGYRYMRGRLIPNNTSGSERSKLALLTVEFATYMYPKKKMLAGS